MGVPAKIKEMKDILSQESVRQQFENALDEYADTFVANLIALYSNDTYLQNCEPEAVVRKALEAATLKLPLNRALGLAYIVPFKRKGEYVPTFIPGYKGLVQLAHRTGQYVALNADAVYEGEQVEHQKLKGTYTISGEPKNDNVKGYFAHMELKSGYTKTIYMTKEEVEAHAERHAPSYGNKNSAWATDFDDMAKKTPLRQLIMKWGIMSTEMITALSSDEANYTSEEEAELDKANEAYEETIDVEEEPEDPEEPEKDGDNKQGKLIDDERKDPENRPEDAGF